ncbi:UDP-3-O-(3-hydroxymyristoyl)glucosamine N-acyltransferase [candidate division WOR-3 bacterium]|nr:UDP-3-O-(3-hydroxymyristoyl)glucosamine N-acyltransferase [candidate division WOR-3 bacterium]
MKLSSAAAIAGGKLIGDPDFEIQILSSIVKAGKGSLTFLDKKDENELAKASEKGAAIICMPGLGLEKGIEAENPYLSFVRVMREFFAVINTDKGIHPTAVISKDAVLGDSVSVGPNVVISDNAVIGNNTVISANCYVGESSQIGSDCTIYPNVTVLRNCSIGNRVIVHPGTVIGSDGFGYLRESGKAIKIPQIGRVIIEDDVEIGANAVVDRAMLDETVVGKGTKIDNLVQVGHNVSIGENCLIASQTGISGSVEVGSGTMMAGQVGIADHAKIGKNAVIMAKSGVSGNVPDGAVYLWIPAMDISLARRVIASLKFLPQMAKKLRKLD